MKNNIDEPDPIRTTAHPPTYQDAYGAGPYPNDPPPPNPPGQPGPMHQQPYPPGPYVQVVGVPQPGFVVGQTVYTVPPTVIGVPQVGREPSTMVCRSCNHNITTRVTYNSSTKTHIFAAILCMFLCCGCIPYLMDSCKNADHYCPNCNAYIGTNGNGVF